jgi:hypothetical protein
MEGRHDYEEHAGTERYVFVQIWDDLEYDKTPKDADRRANNICDPTCRDYTKPEAGKRRPWEEQGEIDKEHAARQQEPCEGVRESTHELKESNA